jgi:integrase
MQVLMREVAAGRWAPPEPRPARETRTEPTFQVLASIWLDRQQRRLAARSIKQYEWALGHLIDCFGDDLPSQITGQRIDAYVDEKLRERDELVAAERRGEARYEHVRDAGGRLRRIRRRPLSNDSINKQLVLLARVLKDAQREGWIGLNPAADPERKLRVARPRRSFLGPEQVAALLEAAAQLDEERRGLPWEAVERIRSSREPAVRLARELGVSDVLVGKIRRDTLWPERAQRRERPLQAPIAVLVLGGLRIDELCGLQGRHLEFARQRVVVDRGNTKTDAGARMIEMSPALVEILEAHRREWPYGPEQFVFGTRSGARGSTDNVRGRVLAPDVARANEMLTDRGLAAMERVTPHTLRRTFVSLALAASGNDIRWLMAQVGHADHKMTYGVYAQLQRNLPRDYGGRVDEIIGGSLWHRQPQRRAGNGQLSFGDG